MNNYYTMTIVNNFKQIKLSYKLYVEPTLYYHIFFLEEFLVDTAIFISFFYFLGYIFYLVFTMVFPYALVGKIILAVFIYESMLWPLPVIYMLDFYFRKTINVFLHWSRTQSELLSVGRDG